MTKKKKAAEATFEIGRNQILGKYWELANLDPETTKGTVTGQLKALDSLREEMGLAAGQGKTERGKENRPGRLPSIYRAAWLMTEK